MLTLETTQTLAGVASVATKVTVTVMGLELSTVSPYAETYKLLYQGQLPNSATTLYTVPATTSTFVRSIYIVNTDTITNTFQLFVSGTTAADAITGLITLQIGGMAVYEDGLGWQFYNSAGQLQHSIFPSTNPTIDNWGINGNKGETMDRNMCVEANNAIAGTGVLYMQAIYLTAGTLVSNISFCSATTAAGTPTHYLFGLFDGSRNLLAATADQTSTAWAANTLKTIAVTTPYTISTTGLYYLGIFMTATTIVTLKGNTARTGGQLAGTAPILNGTSASTGLTTAMPNPAGAITQTTNGPIWGCVT